MKTLTREQLAIEIELQKEKSKGLLIMGEPGMGKTHSIKTPRMVTASELALDYQAYGIQVVKDKINALVWLENFNVTIDDLGLEPKVKNFGNELNPIEWVILRIYSINQIADKPIKLWLTTNFNMQSLTEIYGERVVDRLHEMCDIVVLKDTNLRRG
jgi:DNA replication protein DnaC